MKKDRVRLSLDLSSELYTEVKSLADELDLTITGAIRIAIQEYIKQLRKESYND